jgi:hypothetical protein
MYDSSMPVFTVAVTISGGLSNATVTVNNDPFELGRDDDGNISGEENKDLPNVFPVVIAVRGAVAGTKWTYDLTVDTIPAADDPVAEFKGKGKLGDNLRDSASKPDVTIKGGK